MRFLGCCLLALMKNHFFYILLSRYGLGHSFNASLWDLFDIYPLLGKNKKMAYNSPQHAVRFDFYLSLFKFLIQFLSTHLCLVLSATFAISSRDFKGREPYLSESLLQKLQPLPLMWSVWSKSSSWLKNKMKTVIVAEGCRCCRSLSLRCSQTTNEPAWHFLQRP